MGQTLREMMDCNNADGDVRSNTAELYLAILERARIGVFHYISHTHLPRCLNEVSFRLSNRIPKNYYEKGQV